MAHPWMQELCVIFYIQVPFQINVLQMFSANFYEDHYFIFLYYAFCHRIFSKEIFTYAMILRLSLSIFLLGALLFWISYFGLWFNTFDFCVWCEVGAGFLFLSYNYLVISVLFVGRFFFFPSSFNCFGHTVEIYLITFEWWPFYSV